MQSIKLKPLYNNPMEILY